MITVNSFSLVSCQWFYPINSFKKRFYSALQDRPEIRNRMACNLLYKKYRFFCFALNFLIGILQVMRKLAFRTLGSGWVMHAPSMKPTEHSKSFSALTFWSIYPNKRLAQR